MAAKAKQNPFLAVDKGILADSGTAGGAAGDLFALCDQIGTRFAGTEGYRKAADYMLGRFNASKLDSAELEPFEFSAWRRGERATLVLHGEYGRTYRCYALPYSAASPARGVTARLVDIGAGKREDVEAHRKQIKGRIVMSSCKGVHRTETYARCVKLGAIGFILAGGVDGNEPPTGCVSEGKTGAIPAASVGKEDALQIQRLDKTGGLRFTLTVDAREEPAETWNVVGELTGTERPDDIVVFGGHLDSHEVGPGAFDNAAGAVVVMEAARLLARQRKHLRRTVRFIGFAAEEIGLLGSHHYVKAHAAELKKVKFMLNCDMPALGRPRGLVFHDWSKGESCVNRLSAQMGTDVLHRSRAHCHSDHYPFASQGVPTGGVTGGHFAPAINHYGHMAGDTAEKISVTDLQEVAAFAARVLLRISSDDAWPKTRRTEAEIGRWRRGDVG